MRFFILSERRSDQVASDHESGDALLPAASPIIGTTGGMYRYKKQ